jgi:hypothetical protein
VLAIDTEPVVHENVYGRSVVSSAVGPIWEHRERLRWKLTSKLSTVITSTYGKTIPYADVFRIWMVTLTTLPAGIVPSRPGVPTSVVHSPMPLVYGRDPLNPLKSVLCLTTNVGSGGAVFNAYVPKFDPFSECK